MRAVECPRVQPGPQSKNRDQRGNARRGQRQWATTIGGRRAAARIEKIEAVRRFLDLIDQHADQRRESTRVRGRLVANGARQGHLRQWIEELDWQAQFTT